MYIYCNNTDLYRYQLFRDTVMMLSAINDPDGALTRKKHKLKRKEYHNKASTSVYTRVETCV